ncbi:MAG: ribbon-helix-helix domain-containing protein [Acidimicrobiales bacterium]
MTRQVALKLPDELLDRLDALVAGGRFESRSHAIRGGLELVVEQEARRMIDEAFRIGFAALPEDEATGGVRRLRSGPTAGGPRR